MAGPGLGSGLGLGLLFGLSGEDIPGRDGGVPCLDRWKAFILASIPSDRPPPLTWLPRRLDEWCARFGRRALFSMPRGVDEAVIGAVGGSETDRNEGIRWAAVFSCDGLDASDTS
jgi:hypothetical protein